MNFTNVTDLVWADADHTRIFCKVTFETIGEVPFSASPDDSEAHGRDIFARAKAGEWGAVAPYVQPPEPPVSVPQKITPLQARKALRQLGWKAAVDAFVATLSEEEQEEWDFATEYRRDNAIIAKGATALGLTQEQIDELFRLAVTFQ
jgi:hypothetical protein